MGNMSGYIDYEICPRCGGDYIIDFDCDTLEEYDSCIRCGKMKRTVLLRDDKGKVIFDKNNKPKYLTENKQGYGCYTIVTKNEGTTSYRLNEPVDLEKIKAKYIKILENPDVNKEESYLTFWDTEQKKIIVLFGKDPR